jgi:hypothetical protein
MNILDVVVGKPIKTSDERAEQIGPAQGVPIFGLDGLSSAAYGPEAALSLLLPLGLLGVRYIVPISAAIITLLVIVYFSYRQTIAAYPSGGGSYTVARFNLGAPAGLLAAAALLADYILTAAVGISAGVGALISAVPSLLPHTVSLCLGILLVITILNLRGVREAGTVFAVPTYLFVGTLLITIGGGVLRVLLSGGHPTPVVAPPPPPAITEAVSYWLLLKVFASGCTALTGVEAVSNGVKAFREPTVKNAQRTLTVIIFLLKQLSAARLRIPGQASRIYLRHRCACPAVRWRAVSFRRDYGPTDPTLRRGRVLSFHSLASRHGCALAEKSRPTLDEECVRKRLGCYRHWNYDWRGAGREVRGRRLDYVALYSLDDCVLRPCPPPLSPRENAYQ